MNRKLILILCLLIVGRAAMAQPPVAKINATPLSGCAPLAVSFADGGTGATSWSWNFGTAPSANPATSTNRTAAVLFKDPGTYKVTLTTKNANGTSTAVPVTITVYAFPVADFDVDKTSGCFPVAIHFTDKSNPGAGATSITSYTWDYGDGNLDNGIKNPTHTYTFAGDFPVTLYVKNNLGCQGQASIKTGNNTISITSGVVPDFATMVTSTCQLPATANFTNQTTGPATLSYIWDFNDGSPVSSQTSPAHSYTVAGSYQVKLTANSTQGCNSSITIPVNITASGSNTDFDAPDKLCVNSTAAFTNTSSPTPVSSSWDYGDGSPLDNNLNGSHAFAATGTYHVKLTNTYAGCTGTVTKDIQIVDVPAPAFSGTNLTSCQAPLTASFTDNTAGANDWAWDFGDGTSSTLQNPSHKYTTPGNFTITLIVATGQGCTATLQKPAFVAIKGPSVSIVGLPGKGCAPYPYTASANVTAPDGVKSYEWDLGNGVLFNGQNPPPQTYPYGNFIIKVKITTNGGCTVKDSSTLLVGNIKPVPDFSAAPLSTCVDKAVQFTDLTTGGPDSWLWDFGDGVSGNVKNPSHPYTAPGTYNISLTAYNHGCYGPKLTKTAYITVKPPLASMRYTIDCANPNIYTFTDNSTGPLTWDWSFGDGTSDYTGQNPPPHVYPPGAPKSYTVSLTVTNGTCSNTTTIVVVANEVTTVTADNAVACKNTQVNFTTAHPSNITSFVFDYGDGGSSTSTDGKGSHLYPTAGTYTVQVTTINSVGCTRVSAPIQVKVTGPTAGFSTPVRTGCTTLKAVFTDQSTTSGSALKTWNWSFGDGGVSTAQNPTYTYKTQGVYHVTLKVTDANGCTDSYTDPVAMVLSVLKDSFSTPDVNYCNTSTIPFTNQSAGGFSPQYTWDFKDGTTSTDATPPPHVFAMNGDFSVSLSILDDNGCTATFTMPKPIHIDQPTATFLPSKTYSACPPDSVIFTFKGNYAAKYDWTYGNGTVSHNKDGKAFYTKPDIYTINLTVTSPGGCQASSSATVKIDGPVGDFTYTPLTACNFADVNFQVATTNSLTYTWLYGDGTTPVKGSSPTIMHHYAAPGIYTPVVTLQDVNGCKFALSGTDPITIDGITKTQFSMDKSVFCDMGTVKLKDKSTLGTGTVISGYDWDFGDGSSHQTGMADTAVHTYNTPGNYIITMTITTVNGCSNTSSQTVRVVPSPDISIGGAAPQCAPAVMNFTGIENTPSPDQPLTWAWDFKNGVTSGQQNPTGIRFPKGGSYQISVKATTKSGCSTTFTYLAGLEIYNIPEVHAGADVTVCQNDNLALHATGSSGTDFTWQPPTNSLLTCSNCADPFANNLQNTTYFIVAGMSPDGCSNKDTVNVTVNHPVTVTASGADSVCLGQSVQLHASGAAIYSWSPVTGLSDPNIANPVATPTAAQTGVTAYVVTGYDDHKCFKDMKTVPVTAFANPTVNLGPDVTIPVGSNYNIPGQVTGDIVSMQWTPTASLSCTDCYSPTTSSVKSITYVLSVVNNGTCKAADTLNIKVVCNNNNFFIPNTFSPNGDGANDRFTVRGVGLTVLPSLTIFNRWGQIVFEKKNFSANDDASGWDGLFNGKPAPADVYIYTLQILCDNNTLIPYHGNVTLVR